MSIPLIPRVRVSFKFFELLESMFVSEKTNKHKNAAQEKLSKSFEGRKVLLCSSGRAALYQLLSALPQNKVMIPSYTCSCVADAVRFAKKEIIFVPTDPKTFNANDFIIPDSDTIVLATHQYGYPCDIEKISVECKKMGAVMIEDCAASFGYTIDGKTVGTYGDYAIVSFNSSKLINVPSRGGAIIIGEGNEWIVDELLKNDTQPDLTFKIKNLFKGFIYCILKNKLVYRLYHYLLLESRGKMHFSDHKNPDAPMDDSYHYIMSEWQAFILEKQLKRLYDYVERRKELFQVFDEGINNLIIAKPQKKKDICCCRYTIRVNNRDKFYKQCLRKGVDMDFSHSYIACPSEYSVEHNLCKEILNIPFYPDMSESEVKRIITVLNSIK